MADTSPLIQKVQIEALFGYLTYDLDFSKGLSSEGNISIFYGDNGCGKTTILRLLYGLLTSHPQPGAKTVVSQTPFKRLSIRFTDQSSITVSKAKLVGGFQVAIQKIGSRERVFELKSGPDNAIRGESDLQYHALLTELRSLQVDLVYITDRRGLYTTVKQLLAYIATEPKRLPTLSNRAVAGRQVPPQPTLDVTDLATIIRDIFRSELIELGNFGQRNTYGTYLELANSIVSGGSEEVEPTGRKEELLRKLWSVSTKMESAVAIKAVPPFLPEQFARAIEAASLANINTLSQILMPFLNGLEARLEVMQPYVDRIASFLEELNRFYTGKRFSFSLFDGFAVRPTHGASALETLPFEVLSSGETQLFAIFASVFLTRESSGIVLIDEPELSLNVKWQRHFVDALRRIGAGTSVQYVLATHSIEIITKQEHRVVPLQIGESIGNSTTPSE